MKTIEFRKTGRFVAEITSQLTENSILEIVDFNQLLYTSDPNMQQIQTDYYLKAEIVIEQIQATVNLPSIPVSPVPNIKPQDGEAERQQKILEIQKNYAGVGLTLYEKINGGSTWYEVATIKFQNKNNEYYMPLLVPYFVLGEVDLRGDKDRLGISVTNIGHGYLGNGDSIMIRGSYRATFTALPKVVGVMDLVFEGSYP